MGVGRGVSVTAGKGVSLGSTVIVGGERLGVTACIGSAVAVAQPATRYTTMIKMIVLIHCLNTTHSIYLSRSMAGSFQGGIDLSCTIVADFMHGGMHRRDGFTPYRGSVNASLPMD